MKICLSINSSPWSRFKGGGQIAVHYLASSLSKLGHEVHVIYSKQSREKIDVVVNYNIHWVRHFNIATINLNIFSFGVKAWQLNRKHKFDIFHGNAEEAFFFFAGLPVKIQRLKFLLHTRLLFQKQAF